MEVLKIFILGIGILVGALIFNFFALKVGLLSWFDFIKNPSNANWFSYIWLFIVYPFGLGVSAYAVARLMGF